MEMPAGEPPQKSLREKISLRLFAPGPFDFLFNPVYLIRRPIFLFLKELGPEGEVAVLDFGCGSMPYKSLFTASTLYTGLDLAETEHGLRHIIESTGFEVKEIKKLGHYTRTLGQMTALHWFQTPGKIPAGVLVGVFVAAIVQLATLAVEHLLPKMRRAVPFQFSNGSQEVDPSC